MWKLRQLSSQRFIQKVNFISLINRRGGEKKVVILLQFTRKFFFHGPNSSKSANKIFSRDSNLTSSNVRPSVSPSVINI